MRPALAVALVALAAPHVGGAAAEAAGARCGMVVEERVTLDRDLRCEGPALVLRNPRTIVQLNGHTVTAARACAEAPDTVGLHLESTADGAQVLGPGAVQGFGTGIRVVGTPRAQLRDLRVSESCESALVVQGADGVRARNLVLDRNGGPGSGSGTAVRVERATRFALEASSVFQNGGAPRAAAVDLRRCVSCRIAGNRIVANRVSGVRLDVESNATEVERNVVLGHGRFDLIDQGADNTFALNIFERGRGVPRPALWPLVPDAAPVPPAVAGCGTLHTTIGPRDTATLTCPQDPGLRGLRNSVVGYRFLSPFDSRLLFGATCEPAQVLPASDTGGGALRCTNPNSVWSVILEVTCCLN